MQSIFTYLIPLVFITHIAVGQVEEIDASGDSANEYMLRNSHEDLSRAFDSPERDDWQKPDEVIAFLGDLRGKTIVDLGSGSGYFTLRLLNTGAKVIAADIDDKFLAIIEQKAQDLGLEGDRLKTLRLDKDKLNIGANSVDIVFLVNVYHHISDRINYFNQANNALKEDGKIIIIDFYKKKLPVGPPKNHKISKDIVLEELTSAGYEELKVNTELLGYQYVIIANRF